MLRGVLSTVEDLKTPLNTIALKSTGFWFPFWNKWLLKKGIDDEIETTSRLSITLCLREFIYAEFAEFKNKHIGEYGPDSLKVMIASLEHLSKDTVLREQPDL